MTIEILLNIVFTLVVVVCVIVFTLSILKFAKEKTKEINDKQIEIDELYNCCVQNEYDKQNIYKRLADLEEKQNDKL